MYSLILWRIRLIITPPALL